MSAIASDADRKPDADHEPHAKPEGDPGHDREAGDLAGGKPRRPIDPVADRGPRHQGKPERERKRIAREGREPPSAGREL